MYKNDGFVRGYSEGFKLKILAELSTEKYSKKKLGEIYGINRTTINDLKNALEQHLAGKQITNKVTNPIGYNVKWEGKEKHWMPADACDLI